MTAVSDARDFVRKLVSGGYDDDERAFIRDLSKLTNPQPTSPDEPVEAVVGGSVLLGGGTLPLPQPPL